MPDVSWNPDYRYGHKPDPEKKEWTVEAAIPFSELEADPPGDGTRWRGNFGRERHLATWDKKKYYGKSEYFLWSPNLQRVAFGDPTSFGDLYFGNAPK